ncbi:PLP-dependent aminotransferase family protein [Bosea sp. LjRoot90]|uniref:MocR-like pyridoxine biosynthesis transcription factor PdxR n=1 Tax=Bosea sp. LjRoot90 TaxID=3342342 RepID=UPI003ECE65A5
MVPILGIALAIPMTGRREALHRQLAAAIRDGRLAAGLRLPATRVLAQALGLSRNTVLAAYDLLLAEGYVEARAGSGIYVAPLRPLQAPRRPAAADRVDGRIAAYWRRPGTMPAAGPERPVRFDLRLGTPDIRMMPLAIWQRLHARALRAAARRGDGYGEPAGRPDLRAAIAAHVSFTRAVAAQAGDVVVTAGAQQAFDLIARILVTPGRTVVAVEDPGYPPLRLAFAAAGARIVSVPVDDDGLVVEALPAEANIVCVSPSHQFPLGVAMSLPRRLALLGFAKASGAVIVEDDYDSEFRYGGRPLDALQTLDRDGLVFYVGTFSKTLFPGLRLGFAVVPDWARDAMLAARQAADWHVPLADQGALAAFIAEGHLARHVRRVRRLYGERRAALLTALNGDLAAWLTPIASEAGLHLSARLKSGLSGASIAAAAAEAGVAVEWLERYAVGTPAPAGLAFGFGTIAADEIPGALARLEPVLRRAAG